MWSQVQCFSFAAEPRFIIETFQWEITQSKPEVTERLAQANNLPSCLCFSPFLLALHLYRSLPFCSASSGLQGPSGARLPPGWKCHCLRDSGAATYPMEEHEGHSLSPHHIALDCSLQALAGGHSSLAVRLQRRDGPASAQLNSNSCLLPKAMGWLSCPEGSTSYQHHGAFIGGFGCLVIGNVLLGDSYHSCLSETGTLTACEDGCLKFSGEVCCWLRDHVGHWPHTRKTGDRMVEAGRYTWLL
ncbi:hypothetical protein FQN60_015327 [Etheostoma spectabile]|uniref:Uncharacterized protein n=1 Tax=Etheostoma spectabile TaxID=54343 RepID=A0A5J5CT03_9PERO|nr:hypothetical protein FQN60_015327 [Etheostoma spectabile]